MAEYNNKVQLQNGIVLIDLTQDTVEKDKLFAGITAHDKAGAPVTGEFTIDDELAAQDSLIDQIEQALVGKASGSGGITPSGTLEITENGEYDVTNYASANVSVPTPAPVIQPLNVTENGTYTVPDGVDGYSPVVVNVAGSGGGSEGQIDLAALIDRTITEAVIPDGTTAIGSYVFCLCNKLVSVTLPSSLTNIDQQAFNGCTVLPSINIPDSVNNIGNYAFYNNQKLTSLTLPSGLKTLGANAFGNCKGLTAVTFRGIPTSVQATSFNQCTAVTDVYVPWASGAVANAPWGMTNATIHYNS